MTILTKKRRMLVVNRKEFRSLNINVHPSIDYTRKDELGRSTVHSWWRKFDDYCLKPWLGGRNSGYKVEGEDSRLVHRRSSLDSFLPYSNYRKTLESTDYIGSICGESPSIDNTGTYQL
eukprot:UN17756